MTRTEDELRTLLHAPVDAFAADRVLAGVLGRSMLPRPSSARRHWRIGLVTALAVVVVVGVVFAVVAANPGTRATPQPPVASTAGVAPSTLTVDASVVSFPDASPFQVASIATAAGFQQVGIVRAGGADVEAAVSVAEPGGRSAGLRDGGRAPVDLANGRTAQWLYTDTGISSGPVADSLTWTTESGLGVTVRPFFDGVDDDLTVALANAVQIGAARPLRVPVSSASWPADWTVTYVQSGEVGPDGATGTAGRDVRIEVQLPGARQADVTIEVTGEPSAVGHGGDGTQVVIAGRTWGLIPSADLFSWRGPDWTVRVMATNGAGGHRTVSDAALQAFITGLTIAPSFADESTWFDATDAFPS